MLNNTVNDYFGHKTVTGDIGIEIEVECDYGVLDDYDNPSPEYQELAVDWRIERDGSLIGNSAEFVLKKPCKFYKVDKVVDSFLKEFEKTGNNINPSIRSAIHLHLNCQKMTVKELYMFLMTYYALETALVRSAGDSRQGNLFCLPAIDAAYVVDILDTVLTNQNMVLFSTDNLRYAALNLRALGVYGSIEFRSLATTKDLENIKVWCDIIQKLKDYSSKLKSPVEISEHISGMGGYSFLKSVLGESHADTLDYENLDKDMMANVRNMQVVYYSLDEAISREKINKPIKKVGLKQAAINEWANIDFTPPPKPIKVPNNGMYILDEVVNEEPLDEGF